MEEYEYMNILLHIDLSIKVFWDRMFQLCKTRKQLSEGVISHVGWQLEADNRVDNQNMWPLGNYIYVSTHIRRSVMVRRSQGKSQRITSECPEESSGPSGQEANEVLSKALNMARHG